MKIVMGIGRRLGRLLLAAAFLAPGCTDAPLTDPESPVMFDVGGNDRQVIGAFGGDIAGGQGSQDPNAYRTYLQQLVLPVGRPAPRIVDESLPGTTSAEEAGRIETVLHRDRPAALLLLSGENDEAVLLDSGNAASKRQDTIAALRAIIGAARANHTLVVVSTLPPVCGLARAARRDRSALLNDQIRALAYELSSQDLGVLMVDAWRDFLAAAPPDGCALIGESGERPNTDGYRVLAGSWAAALKHVAW